MNNNAQGKTTRGYRWIRTVLLLLTFITSPILCCSGSLLLDALPSSWLPGPLDFMVNLFESNVRVENKTPETLYLTAVTTTYGDPRVIPQHIGFRQRNIPVRPQSSVVLQYDSADFPLSGIAICRAEDDCRLLPVNDLVYDMNSNESIYELSSYESLERLDPNWLAAIQLSPLHNYGDLVIIVLSLAPFFLFLGWLYLNRLDKTRAG